MGRQRFKKNLLKVDDSCLDGRILTSGFSPSSLVSNIFPDFLQCACINLGAGKKRVV